VLVDGVVDEFGLLLQDGFCNFVMKNGFAIVAGKYEKPKSEK
jgi:hypothetical protein